MFPVVEPEKFVIRATAKDQDNNHNEESNDAKDFQREKPEFGLSIIFDWEAVQCYNHNHKNRDPHSDIDRWVPVLNDYTGCSDLRWYGDCKVVPVHPTQGEAYRFREEPASRVDHCRSRDR